MGPLWRNEVRALVIDYLGSFPRRATPTVELRAATGVAAAMLGKRVSVGEHNRIVCAALQDLRRARRIRFDRKAGGWRLTHRCR